MIEQHQGKSRLYLQSPGGPIEEIAANVSNFEVLVGRAAPSLENAVRSLERFGEQMRRASFTVKIELNPAAKAAFETLLRRQYRVTPALRAQMQRKGRPGWKRRR